MSCEQIGSISQLHISAAHSKLHNHLSIAFSGY